MAQIPELAPPPASSRTRRFLLPLVIIIVGAAFTIWSTQKATKQADRLEQIVLELCESAARGESVAGSLASSDPIMIEQLERSLAAAFGGHADRPGEIEVEVAPGDSARLGAGTESLAPAEATHTVVISLDDQPCLGLRIRYVDENDIRLVGCFQPQ
ncbi:MAG: hypothetical protein JSV91_08630 [Phycisphaerales bacterium]|nr:MAG: hypothetical protein JSV91_08630 [Phycisphaerales bacterium]